MNTIISSLEDLQEKYDVIVIGSGYGGGIAASRLSRAKKSVCLLERGREFLPGEFPDTLFEASSEMQVDTKNRKLGSGTGLFNFHVGDDISVLTGCGLGGTSLINANVSLKMDPRVFKSGKWPKDIVADKDGLDFGYHKAEEMLKPAKYPDHYPKINKLEAHRKSGAFLKEPFYKTPINVNFESQTNHVGVEQSACNDCGDCVSGCNYTAKNTTQMNYLPDAWNHGAEIFTECNVSHVKKIASGWQVFFKPVGLGRKKFDAPLMFVESDFVVVSAGTLGSTEIMLRSARKGLSVSKAVGSHFSGNGDVLGFGYNNDQVINGIGTGTKKPEKMSPVGPCISSVIDTRETSNDYEDGLIIEEGSIPGALSSALPPIFATASGLIGEDTDSGVMDRLKEVGRQLVSLARGAYHGAVRNTQTYLIMSHDSDDGKIRLNKKNRIEINWPGVGREKIFEKANNTLKKCTEALGGIYIKNPIWTKVFGKDLISVHPLGGCIMAEDAKSGVVNHKGQVFDPNTSGVHDGLYITDGSIIPTSLGVNPLLTISAISERNMAILAKENNWSIDYTLPSQPRVMKQSENEGIRFTETMKGYFEHNEAVDFTSGFEEGKKKENSFEFTLTIQVDDVDRMIRDPEHKGEIVGTVNAPGLSKEPLMVAEGVFNLFVDYKKEYNTKRMKYALPLRAENGDQFFVQGYKQIDDTDGLKIWHETSTLYITLFENNENGRVIGKGILHIKPLDFLKQMTTMKVISAPNNKRRLETMYKFGKYFAGSLFDVYGGMLKKNKSFHPEAPARKKRPLRAGVPEIHPFVTADGINLRLTRYKGGKKGPVICAHGLGVASSIFSTDLIDTNLLEYLYAHQYDVWLLDYRASIELPASSTQFSGDEIAKYDYPAAVETVQKITSARDVQFVVHCFGSTTWTMAMLAGLQGVRSAVCSQVSTHIVAPSLTKVKSGLHTPGLLDKIGVQNLTAFVDSDANWANKLFDELLKVYPLPYHEWCNNPVCHRITFLYSLLYEHHQLNQELHDNLHELFGLANITSFEHLAMMVRKGHVVNLDGENIYLPNAQRMAIPIRFISGEKNDCFLPESTEETYDFLCNVNGSDHYSRKVIPGYGHIDCIFGENAVDDVYPFILEHLEATL